METFKLLGDEVVSTVTSCKKVVGSGFGCFSHAYMRSLRVLWSPPTVGIQKMDGQTIKAKIINTLT